MPRSTVNNKYEFNSTIWVISVLNKGSKLGGHATIVVEGLQNNPMGFHNELFVGQYDINAVPFEDQKSRLNVKGAITKICCFESNTYTNKQPYSSYPSKSYLVGYQDAKAMIASIKEDKRICEQASRNEQEYPLYQYLGKKHFLADEEEGDNCASWCVSKLAVAGVGDRSAKSKPKVVVGSCVIL